MNHEKINPLKGFLLGSSRELISHAAGLGIFVTVAVSVLNNGLSLHDFSIRDLAAVPLSYFLGWMFGAAFVWPLFSPLILRACGAPFLVGDKVIILVGKNRGSTVQVYDVWVSRLQLRVDLGSDFKEKLLDVFSFYQVFKVE